MARTAAPQVPRHFIAQLSHLQSRPDVQSTLILSRKDGSIIQATGQLAQLSSPNPSSPPAHSPVPESAPQDSANTDPELATPSEPEQQDSQAPTTASPAQETPYNPSQAETLAAHIFAYVSSASALSTSLSRSAAGDDKEAEYGGSIIQSTPQTTLDGNQEDRHEELGPEEDDELKLLRLRTKVHEIIIFPDRRFLLCVVHELAAMGGLGGGK